MNSLDSLGKILIVLGSIILLVGIILVFVKNVPLIGKLPGDILIKKKNFTFYFPITTSIIISILLSLILYLFLRK